MTTPQCGAFGNDAARLACYDALARPDAVGSERQTAPPSPAAGGDLIVMPRKEAEALRAMAQRSAPMPERARKPFESKIANVFITGYETINVRLANGETLTALRQNRRPQTTRW